jgi:hypothetical protein
MPVVAHRVVTPRGVANSGVPADQRADGQCSYMWYGECEPSII